MIYVPWTRRSVETITNTDDKDRTRTTQRERIERGHVSFLPSTLAIDGKIELQPKRRGIYTVQVYTLNVVLKGRFDLPPALEAPPGPGTLAWGKPVMHSPTSRQRTLVIAFAGPMMNVLLAFVVAVVKPT